MEIEVVDQKEMTTMAVKRYARFEDMGIVMSKGYELLWEYITKAGGVVIAEPYVEYLCEHDLEGWNMEIGFPVSKALLSSGDIYVSKISSGKVATAILKGGYDGLHRHWQEFLEEVKKSGNKINGIKRDHYLNDPSQTRESELLTRTVIGIE